MRVINCIDSRNALLCVAVEVLHHIYDAPSVVNSLHKWYASGLNGTRKVLYGIVMHECLVNSIVQEKDDISRLYCRVVLGWHAYGLFEKQIVST
jgi:hypothetical protein